MNGSRRDTQNTRPSIPATGLVDIRPAMALALTGCLLALGLFWFGVLAPWNRAVLPTLQQAGGATLAAALSQASDDLQAQTVAAARSPRLLQALHSNAPQSIEEAEAGLAFIPSLVSARILPVGYSQHDTDSAAPLSYSALDMLRRTERGTSPAAEIYKVGPQQLIYSTAALRETPEGPVLGTLLLVYELQRITRALDQPLQQAPQIGQFRLLQSVLGSTPQALYEKGEASSAGQYAFGTANPNWTLSFSPGERYDLSYPWYAHALTLLAMLLALGATFAALRLNARRVERQLEGDARQLEQLLDELCAGKPVKAFSLRLPALNRLAQSLARFSLRNQQPGASTGATPGPTASNAPALPRASITRGTTRRQDTDSLAIDILDEDQDFLGPEHPTVINQTPPAFPASIFRAYDIRGVYGKTLSAETAYWIGRAIGAESLAQGEPNVSVGRDGRLSGPVLVEQLIQGLYDAGCHVSDVGLVPTPALYYAANVLAGKSGVMLTGSHNPRDYNGFKIVIAGDTLANEQIQALHTRLQTNDLSRGQGSIEQVDILDRYFQQIRDDIVLARKLKVVVDCGNGAAGVIAPQLIEALGCTVIPLFCEVDGNFPNHHPDPGKLENLADLIAKVKSEQADLGLAFDGDGDRVGVVTNTGNVVYPDRLLMLFTQDVLARNPGADIIFDVKCTRRLTPLISEYGGRPVMWKTGHSLIKKKMKQTGALLAGEMSGHIFFKERWFGFDDGIYSAARLLEIVSQQQASVETLFSRFPNDISTPEININVTDENKFSIIDALHDAQWGDASLTTLDGVRVDYPDGWGLVRASNTTPVLVLRFEAETETELQRIKDVFHAQLKRVAPDLQLPF